MSESGSTKGSGLLRTIGVLGLAAAVINVTIGSSVFVFPATVAAALGAAGILPYLVAAALMGLIALCFAESGSRVTGAGGSYAYVGTAFGPFAGWLVGLLIYLGVQLIASAVVGSVFVRSLSVLVPSLGSGVPRAVLLAVIFAGFALVNIRGGSSGGIKVVQWVTFAKLAPLLLLVVVGLVGFRPEYVRWETTPPVADIGRMAMRLIYLFAGVEAVLAVSGEIRDPSRTVPRGIFLGLATVTVIYLGVQFAAQGLLGPALPTHDRAPLADAAAVMLGDTGRIILVVGGMLSTLGFLSADMLASPRTLFAMADAGRLPRALATVHPKYQSPAVAIALHAGLACILAIYGDFDTLTALASSAILSIYLLCCAATLVLQRRRVGDELHPLKLPLGPVIPLLAIALVIALMTTLARNEVIALGIIIVAAGLSYQVSRRGSR